MEIKVEKERKFLVKKADLSALEDSKEITQGYLSIDPSIRVRVEDLQNCFLTIKIKEEPGVNTEIGEPLPEDIARILLRAHKYHKIRKVRYPIGRLEIDVFLERLVGLVLIEFEYRFVGEQVTIPPGFLVEEVTGDPRFENQNLCQLDKLPDEWRCQDVSRSL